MVNEDEQEYEASINYNTIDPTATIATVNQVAKIRKLNRAIGETLKLLYNYRCQICGENISARYGVNIVESHHIDPFVESSITMRKIRLLFVPIIIGLSIERDLFLTGES